MSRGEGRGASAARALGRTLCWAAWALVAWRLGPWAWELYREEPGAALWPGACLAAGAGLLVGSVAVPALGRRRRRRRQERMVRVLTEGAGAPGWVWEALGPGLTGVVLAPRAEGAEGRAPLALCLGPRRGLVARDGSVVYAGPSAQAQEVWERMGACGAGGMRLGRVPRRFRRGRRPGQAGPCPPGPRASPAASSSAPGAGDGTS